MRKSSSPFVSYEGENLTFYCLPLKLKIMLVRVAGLEAAQALRPKEFLTATVFADAPL